MSNGTICTTSRSNPDLREGRRTAAQEKVTNSQDFTTAFTVDQTPAQAFAAITDVRGWWSGEIEGRTDRIDEEFTYRCKDVHYSKQKITVFVPGKKVAWLVLDSRLNFVEDPSEWNGTKITFEVAEKNGKTEVRFAHVGLVPECECFEGCSNAWRCYVNASLRNLIVEGESQPNAKDH